MAATRCCEKDKDRKNTKRNCSVIFQPNQLLGLLSLKVRDAGRGVVSDPILKVQTITKEKN
jgi:hypothetical protein